MQDTARRLLVGAALAGFIAGTTAIAIGSPRPGDDTKTTKTKIEKHCCAGKNTCKGKGGCGADKGKNDCSGKGGCSTKTSCKGQPCTDKS